MSKEPPLLFLSEGEETWRDVTLRDENGNEVPLATLVASITKKVLECVKKDQCSEYTKRVVPLAMKATEEFFKVACNDPEQALYITTSAHGIEFSLAFAVGIALGWTIDEHNLSVIPEVYRHSEKYLNSTKEIKAKQNLAKDIMETATSAKDMLSKLTLSGILDVNKIRSQMKEAGIAEEEIEDTLNPKKDQSN